MIVPQHFAPALVQKFDFGLLLQRAARHHPADFIGDFGNELRSGNQRQQTFAAAGRDGTNDATHVGRAAFGDIETNLAKLVLMLTEHEGIFLQKRLKNDDVALDYNESGVLLSRRARARFALL